MTDVLAQKLAVNDVVGGFRVERAETISELRSTAYQFVHEKTGAKLIHLYNDDVNNLFSIAFRTPVNNSTGVPHILEHSVLCGSKKFPLKDPFQELLKGSLQTFLNAMTYPDKTVYPVSSQVEKDFYNLVDVYCDAVLNPLITENTFYQEGWHYDLENIDGEIDIKGIVYNEMKGVFSDFSSYVGRGTFAKLFPDTSYSNESGGDPKNIPDLTFDEFKNFHRKFYHPSNSYIFLYGNLPSAKTLNFINDNYLCKFEKLAVNSEVSPQKLWSKPQTANITAPAPKEDDGSASVICAWIFGESADPVAVLSGLVLSHYLLSTESSPLRRALIDSGLGEDLDDISGFDSDLMQCVFSVGLRKTKPEHAEAILDIINTVLKKEVERGFDAELLEGALRQTEFHLREIINGHFPYNLRLADRCYRAWLNNGDPFALLAFEKPLAQIKEAVRKGTFFEDIVKSKMLDNSHRLLSTITASYAEEKKLETQTKEQAARLTKNFTEADKRRCLELTKTLRNEQEKPSPPEAAATLPKLSKTDLPKTGRTVPMGVSKLNDVPFFMHPIFSAGIAYLDIGFDFNGVPIELVPYIPLYLELITRCGAAGKTYEQMAKRISLSTGGIDASVSCKTRLGAGNDELFFMAFFHGKSLEERFDDMADILEDLLLSPDLSNKKQIRDLLFEERNALASSVIHSGHSFAITNASARLSRSRAVDEMLGGITQLRFLDATVGKENFDEASECCQKLHEFLINRSTCVISVTANDPSKFTSRLEKIANSLPLKTVVNSGTSSINSADIKKIVGEVGNTGIEIGSAVNFAARAWKLSNMTAAENGRLFLLSRNLSTGYLWDKIRVLGGAYGGMSGMSIAHPVFTCASYRDPNLEETLAHFEGALKEAAAGIDTARVDQSIIGAIGRIDHPKTPHALGMGETMDNLAGCTVEYRQELRDAVLGATSADLKLAAQKVLSAQESAITVLGSPAAFDKAQANGITFLRENLKAT